MREQRRAALRTLFDIGPESVVFDVGAYKGKWSYSIADYYSAKVHGFEPVPEFAAQYRKRNPDCTLHEYAVGGKDDRMILSVDADATSFYRHGAPLLVSVKSMATVLSELGVAKVDLCKINIEGSEYELMEHLIEAGLLPAFRAFYIQFHPWPDGYEARYEAIAGEMQKTFSLMERTPFIWEYWKAE